MEDDAPPTDEGGSIDDMPSDVGPFVSASPMLSGASRFGAPTPIFQPAKSTALDDDESAADPAIPRTALWVMKYRRHRTFRRSDDDALRVALGEGDERVYVTDDGDAHVMVTRQVGVDPQGVE
jgi:hypothetical protein